MKTKNLLNSSRFSTRLRTLFVMLVTLSMFNMYAVDTEDLAIGDITYTLTAADNTMSITGYTGTGQTATYLNIPETYVIDGETYTVTLLHKAFQAKTGITNVILPSTLVEIGLRSFQDVDLDSLIVPASVKVIGSLAFLRAGIPKLIFEEGNELETIVYRAFDSCSGMTSFTLPSETADNTASWSKDGVSLNGIFEVPSADFKSAFSADWVSKAAAASVLSFNANSGTGTMDPVNSTVGATVTLPANSFTKADYYFKGWATATNGEVLYADGASFTSTAEAEELFAIWGLSGDLILDNGEGVQETIEIGVGRTLILPATSFTKAGHYLYGWATTAVGDAYYSFEASYTPLSTSQTLYAIWEPIPADYMTTGMEMLKISDLTHMTDGQSLTITAYTENGQDSTHLYIPSTYVVEGVVYTVTEFGAQAFKSKGLTSIILPNTLIILGDRALHDNNIVSITIPASVTTLIDYAFGYNYELKTVIFEEGSQLKTIGANAFLNHADLDSITIPASVKSIGNNAFDGSVTKLPNSLLKVMFEEGSALDSIAAGAFNFCTALPSITLPSIRAGYSSVVWKKDGIVLNDYVVDDDNYNSVFTAVWEEIPTDVFEKSVNNDQLVISPNPAMQSFSINVEAISTQIYSLSGQCVKQFPMGVSTFDISSLESGLYLVKVQEANGKMSVDQLIKK